jgi:hypothetical protein
VESGECKVDSGECKVEVDVSIGMPWFCIFLKERKEED